eukprot:4150662-Ditylum_brightwellii.AAC.1
MATSDKPDIIVDFTNIASYTNENGGKYKHGDLYSTNKRVEVAETYEVEDIKRWSPCSVFTEG